jgi:hypothetical protein
LESELGALSFDKVVYIGDGGGDYCACTRLRKDSDTVLARHGFPLSDKIVKAPIQARFREWKSGDDILSIFREIL